MNEEHVEVVRAGKETIDNWRAANPGVRLDLRGAILDQARLQEADLKGANLKGARLILADLENANLQSANLEGAVLTNAILKNTSFDGAQFGWGDLCEIDLRAFEGHEIMHSGPSRIDYLSLRLTEGDISERLEDFLRCCGLERWEIEIARMYNPNWTANEMSEHLSTKVLDKRTPGANHLGGVFISYSHDDAKLVDKLEKALKAVDVVVYRDIHDFTPGSLEKNIDRAIKINDRVVVVLSQSALASDWVWDEIATTLEKEKKSGKAVLFPIGADDGIDDDGNWRKAPDDKRRLMRKLKERLILDFSKPGEFRKNFKKLITGMKVNQ